MEENFVIKEIKNGDSGSFKILYEKYQSKLFAYVYCKVSDKAEVEDLMQEVFAKVYKNIDLYDESKSSFYNFILTNAKQVISDYFRNNNNYENRIEKIYLNSNVISDEDIAIIYDSIDGEYNLKSVLDKLPETQRMALNLVYIKNMSYKDAARIMNKSELSVKSLIFRAKRTLKKDIAEKYPEIVKEYGFKKVAKAVVISTVCFGLIGGFSYAAFKVYMDKFYKGTYTVADVKSEISDDKAIDKEKAKDIINEYLTVLGYTNLSDVNDLHLYRDYMINEIYWTVEKSEYKISINAVNGKLLSFAIYDDKSESTVNFSDEVLKKLKLCDGYDLISDEVMGEIRNIEYAKKYGDLVNEYQSVKIMVENNKIRNVRAIDYDYTDTEINISKEEAINIFEENGIEILNGEIDLKIKNVGTNKDTNNKENLEKLTEDEMYNLELPRNINDIRKVWVYIKDFQIEYMIDANTGEFIEISR